MGLDDPEEVRCRVYGGEDGEAERVSFMHALAGPGVIDCPAYDGWVVALRERGWLPAEPEPNPDGPGRIGRWRLTAKGHDEWERMNS